MQILHVVRNPMTGVARAIHLLMSAQLSAGHSAKLLIIASENWQGPVWFSSIQDNILKISPEIFGTAAYLTHGLGYGKKKIARAMEALVGNETSIIHYHNAWLSGALMQDRATLKALGL